MAAKFKNLVTEIDTTGSAQLLLRCTAGKVNLIKNLIVHNENGSSSSFFLAFEDNSISTTSFPINAGTTTSGNQAVFTTPFVLEENDEVLLQTSVADQQVTLHYVELDAGVRQKYRMIGKSLTTADSADSFLTCPAGSTIIVNLVNFFNQSGGTASNNLFTITDSSTSTTKTIDKGSINNNSAATFHRTFVLESGDSLNFTPDEQPMTVYASFLEIRNPPIRGQ